MALKKFWNSKQIQVRPIIDPQSASAYAFPVDITFILRILVHNAIKYSKIGGKIEVIATYSGQADEMVEIIVKDYGIGMDEQDLQAFKDETGQFRVDTELVRHIPGKSKGSRIGLAICEDLVLRNGGNMNVESKKDEFTTFTVCIPHR